MKRTIERLALCCTIGLLTIDDSWAKEGDISSGWENVADHEALSSTNPYAVLGVEPTASIRDIIQAYRTLDTHYRDTPGSDDNKQKRARIYDAFQAILNPPLPQHPSG